MVQLVLEGDTLGKRHQHYNELVKEAITEKKAELEQISKDDNDLANLMKIDIASNNRNVEYILEVLKSEDMLYVSRAIKRCPWLVTDPQFAHIINPDYLHTQLFPQMTPKASNKLILHIRLNLKEKVRVESFYKYYKNENKKNAIKWLPNCSLAFIEKEVETIDQLEEPLLKRLCEKSISILKIYIKKSTYFKGSILKATMFLLHTSPEKYFDIVDTVEAYEVPQFNAKYTAVIMKTHPERILNNFIRYSDHIDLETFAKYLKTDVKEFLLKYINDESMQYWFRFENLKHFVKRIPKEGRFEFLKKVFIDKEGIEEDNSQVGYCPKSSKSCGFAIYCWYHYAPFNVAFSDLKKMIRTESVPIERAAILAVLISCAGRDLRHIHTLLQYYHDKHINESFNCKMQFINNVITQTDTHVFDDKTWNILNTIFCSLDVYSEHENKMQHCIEAIIVYKILHSEKVPEIIEKKFRFNSMKLSRLKLNDDEKNKIFGYLYNVLVTKIQNKIIHNETEFVEAVHLLKEILILLEDYRKELQDYPWVYDKIKEYIKIKQSNSWTADMSILYNKNKLWRKDMFEDSLLLSPTEEACVNALKHNVKLLDCYKSELEELFQNDKVSLRHLLSKIRIYGPQSLANKWAETYIGRLENPGGHKALVRGLCVLLPQKELLHVVKRYAPIETKITWNEDDDYQLNLRKQIAKNMYLARPPPPPEVVLLYAQGDYLQFALPSLNAILYSLRPVDSREHIKKFMEAPVSLQKHGIRLALTKLESHEVKQIFADIWKSNKNSTIRAVLFKQTYNLLCKEKQSSTIEEIWELLNMFIDNLSLDEDKTIYGTLGKVQSAPLSVRPKFFIKGYEYLKSLPAKAESADIIEKLVNSTRDFMELLDADFMADILLNSIEKKITTKRYSYVHIMSPFLLSAKNTQSQTQRYEKVLVPLLERSFEFWNVKTDGNYFFRKNLNALLKQLSIDFQEYVLMKNMVSPVKLFTDILTKLQEKLPMQQNYVMLTAWKLEIIYVKLFEQQKPVLLTASEDRGGCHKNICSNLQLDEIRSDILIKVAPDFSKMCIEYLKEDVNKNFPSIYLLFANAVDKLISYMEISNYVYLVTLKAMLGCNGFIESYLMVLKAVPDYHWHEKETQEVVEIRKVLCSHPSAEVKMHYFQKYETCDLEIENKALAI